MTLNKLAKMIEKKRTHKAMSRLDETKEMLKILVDIDINNRASVIYYIIGRRVKHFKKLEKAKKK